MELDSGCFKDKLGVIECIERKNKLNLWKKKTLVIGLDGKFGYIKKQTSLSDSLFEIDVSSYFRLNAFKEKNGASSRYCVLQTYSIDFVSFEVVSPTACKLTIGSGKTTHRIRTTNLHSQLVLINFLVIVCNIYNFAAINKKNAKCFVKPFELQSHGFLGDTPHSLYYDQFKGATSMETNNASHFGKKGLNIEGWKLNFFEKGGNPTSKSQKFGLKVANLMGQQNLSVTNIDTKCNPPKIQSKWPKIAKLLRLNSSNSRASESKRKPRSYTLPRSKKNAETRSFKNLCLSPRLNSSQSKSEQLSRVTSLSQESGSCSPSKSLKKPDISTRNTQGSAPSYKRVKYSGSSSINSDFEQEGLGDIRGKSQKYKNDQQSISEGSSLGEDFYNRNTADPDPFSGNKSSHDLFDGSKILAPKPLKNEQSSRSKRTPKNTHKKTQNSNLPQLNSGEKTFESNTSVSILTRSSIIVVYPTKLKPSSTSSQKSSSSQRPTHKLCTNLSIKKPQTTRKTSKEDRKVDSQVDIAKHVNQLSAEPSKLVNHKKKAQKKKRQAKATDQTGSLNLDHSKPDLLLAINSNSSNDFSAFLQDFNSSCIISSSQGSEVKHQAAEKDKDSNPTDSPLYFDSTKRQDRLKAKYFSKKKCIKNRTEQEQASASRTRNIEKFSESSQELVVNVLKNGKPGGILQPSLKPQNNEAEIFVSSEDDEPILIQQSKRKDVSITNNTATYNAQHKEISAKYSLQESLYDNLNLYSSLGSKSNLTNLASEFNNINTTCQEGISHFSHNHTFQDCHCTHSVNPSHDQTQNLDIIESNDPGQKFINAPSLHSYNTFSQIHVNRGIPGLSAQPRNIEVSSKNTLPFERNKVVGLSSNVSQYPLNICCNNNHSINAIGPQHTFVNNRADPNSSSMAQVASDHCLSKLPISYPRDGYAPNSSSKERSSIPAYYYSFDPTRNLDEKTGASDIAAQSSYKASGGHFPGYAGQHNSIYSIFSSEDCLSKSFHHTSNIKNDSKNCQHRYSLLHQNQNQNQKDSHGTELCKQTQGNNMIYMAGSNSYLNKSREMRPGNQKALIAPVISKTHDTNINSQVKGIYTNHHSFNQALTQDLPRATTQLQCYQGQQSTQNPSHLVNASLPLNNIVLRGNINLNSAGHPISNSSTMHSSKSDKVAFCTQTCSGSGSDLGSGSGLGSSSARNTNNGTLSTLFYRDNLSSFTRGSSNYGGFNPAYRLAPNNTPRQTGQPLAKSGFDLARHRDVSSVTGSLGFKSYGNINLANRGFDHHKSPAHNSLIQQITDKKSKNFSFNMSKHQGQNQNQNQNQNQSFNLFGGLTTSVGSGAGVELTSNRHSLTSDYYSQVHRSNKKLKIKIHPACLNQQEV